MSNLIRVRLPKTLPPLTEAEKQELADAMKRPINYDDIPPLTNEQLAKMHRVHNETKFATACK
ncbi:MAG: hypothetical protein J5477_06695 [Schwartzia sp.]|nr:hypothetical protein [Schwartzia sp. (in: firmicutes)]